MHDEKGKESREGTASCTETMKIEVTREMDVRPEDFYDYMVETIRQDIERQLDVELTVDEIRPGYTHRIKKKDKQGNIERVRYTIREAKRPEKFITVFSSAGRQTKITYLFGPSKKGTKLTYCTEVTLSGNQKEPEGARRTWSEFSSRTRISRQMSDAEIGCQKFVKEREKKAEKEERERLAKERKEAREQSKKGGFSLFKKHRQS